MERPTIVVEGPPISDIEKKGTLARRLTDVALKLAEALSEILPDGDRERELPQGLLNQRESLMKLASDATDCSDSQPEGNMGGGRWPIP